ncbi:GNAT family N-acetyltransferase [Spongiactinospora sp. TRM90649]|uniref:GNAT family N-acetyltransferase n=1 Tax=Spongiactinospora sp. TRM90649 TaxID=3031114 RepID=UPI0023F6F79B|nr:GNAT family N-acetyltransferase [Spongiactinospora sp. TRM90649]MDF5755024.1 GNAT family N-acetyltransferase [Spongiactinospora sp. TRM90649]
MTITSIRTLPYDALGAEELDSWHTLRSANPALDSPYFHPGFAAAVHASGAEVLVAVARDEGGKVRALLPHHRERALIRPVGWPGADFQAPIMEPGCAFPVAKLLAKGVRQFAFDHLLDGLGDFEPWVESRRPSPHVDTTGGLDGYLGRASRSGKDNMGQARRRTAKAERELGPIRFAADIVDESALDQVIELKRAQYAATGARDYFATPGRRELLSALLHTRGTSFAGVLSTLHAGPHLLAAHFGMRSDGVLHWWFPVYDPARSNLAPGWILLRELVAAAPELGVTRIDLGRGDDEYKRRAKTGETMVCQGMVTRGTAGRLVRRAGVAVTSAVKRSPIAPALRRAVHGLRSLSR